MTFSRVLRWIPVGASVLATGAFGEALYDRFGQLADFEFAGKVHDESELRADAAADEAYYASFAPPARTFWGSLPGSRERYGLTATGFFHLEEVAALGGRKLFVDPAGDLYFHIGMCCLCPGNDFTPVQGREDQFEWVPSAANGFGPARWGVSASYYIANWIRKYGSYDQTAWQSNMVGRCRTWGFNGYGAFTNIDEPNRSLGFATTRCLEHYMQDEGFHLVEAKHFDPYDERNLEPLERALRRRMEPYLGKADLLGWYTENETRYSRLLPAVRELPADVPARRRFDEILAAGGDEKDFEREFYDRFFRILSETLRRIDPDHLYLGERCTPDHALYEPSAAAMGRYCDVYSVNYYTDGFDRETVRKYAAVSGRPVILSEWSFGCREQGLFGCRDCESQEISGREYRRYIENAAALDCVVGAQFFCLIDEPASGRGWSLAEGETGERMQMGFLNVCDRPFRTFVAQAAQGNYAVYDVLTGAKGAFDADEPPRTVQHAGTRQTVAAKSPAWSSDGIYFSLARRAVSYEDWCTLRYGWDESAFHVCVRVPDTTPTLSDHGGAVDAGDAVSVCLATEHPRTPGRMLPSDRELVVLANTDGAPRYEWRRNGEVVSAAAEPAIRCTLDDAAHWTMEIDIPWAAFGFTPAPGKSVRFDIAVNRSGTDPLVAVDRLVWNGTEMSYTRREFWALFTLLAGATAESAPCVLRTFPAAAAATADGPLEVRCRSRRATAATAVVTDPPPGMLILIK